MRLCNFHFIFENAHDYCTDRIPRPLHVVGIYAYINNDELPMKMKDLVAHLNILPTLRAIVLLFSSYDDLQDALWRALLLENVFAGVTLEHTVFNIAYVTDEKDRAVNVGPSFSAVASGA